MRATPKSKSGSYFQVTKMPGTLKAKAESCGEELQRFAHRHAHGPGPDLIAQAALFVKRIRERIPREVKKFEPKG